MWIRKYGDGKKKCKEFYDKWEGEKVAFSSFYQKVSDFPDQPREELIIPGNTGHVKVKKRYTGRYVELWDWYSQQENPGVKFSQFVSRVRDGGYKKEEAILTGPEWKQIMEEKAKTRVIDWKQYSPTYTKKEPPKQNDDYFFIKITYPPQIARVFMKEYEDLLEDLEWKVKDIFDKDSRNKIEADITRIRTEIMVFKSYNNL